MINLDSAYSEALKKHRRTCAKRVLDLHYKANAGHIGTSLSCLEILVYLFYGIQKEGNKGKVVLSKGHGASALYSTLAEFGWIDESLLQTYYQDGTSLAAHPPCNHLVNGIPFGTGSLGHGLSLSVGMALGARMNRHEERFYCVLSDGDCNEGSTWEAAMFAAHHKLNHLCVVVDQNGIQGIGSTRDILDLNPLEDKFRTFGFDVAIAENGNSFNDLHSAIKSLEQTRSNRPKAVIAKTIKGHSVSYMQNKMEWHYLPMNEEQYRQALQELERNAT